MTRLGIRISTSRTLGRSQIIGCSRTKWGVDKMVID
uniref:Uncharacterized protein n=1 Tax=virus sp. ctLpa4 TaxID=2825814 RepID=A0A8S5RLY5_9VIRU|nr:MAG TPA: hypothetical protein [virus sp. ctLpa4]